jgi:chromosome segregation ATPase
MASKTVTLLMDGATVQVMRTAHGAVVAVTNEDGEQVTADTAQVEQLRELLEVRDAQNDGFFATLETRNETITKLHAQRMDLSEKLREATARAYAAERRVRELEARIESMEMDAKVEGYRHG